jgi:GR25 family glycosyltransferase involved in LPS biosynthesis
MDQENYCEFVGSRGIMKSCDIYSSSPRSSIRQLINYDFSILKPGSTIYVCGSAVPHFVQTVAPQIPFGYILVSGDCDQTVPNDLFASDQEFKKFIESSNLIHWFSQNCVLTSHPKLSQIPIGLDYHTMAERDHEWGNQTSPLNQEKLLKTVASKAKPLDERICKAYANFQFLMTTKFGSDRVDAINQVPKDLVFYEPTKIKRLNTWVSQSKYAFVISPHGNGLDCHRTWEALALGCIPIVKTSPLDSLFYELPILIVNQWSDVTQELLINTVQEYKTKQFNMEKLKLSYWIKKILKYKYLELVEYVDNFYKIEKCNITIQNIDTKIIHYTPLVERKKFMEDQMILNKLNYNFITTFDREELTINEINKFNTLKLKMAEISLFLKHIEAFKTINEVGLIFEDDAILCNNFNNILSQYISQIPQDWDFVFLGNGCNLHIPKQITDLDTNINVFIKSNLPTSWGGNGSTRCADSYLVNKKCVKILLGDFCLENKIDQPYDHWLNKIILKNNLKVYWIEPTIVSQGTENNMFKSSLR